MDTIDRTDRYTVKTLDDLDRIYAKPAPRVLAKETDHVTAPGRAFIAASPFLILATGTETGLDCSPKGDAPGFVQLLDDRTLLIPDRPGNNRVDGMKNLLADPKVGIIFMAPGTNETYRVNGTATISVDPDLLARFEVGGKLPRAVMVVAVQQAFSHCPKALIRAKLWDAAAAEQTPTAPTIGEFAADRDGGDAEYAAKYNEDYAKRIPKELY